METGTMVAIKFEADKFKADFDEIVAAIEQLLDSENGENYEEQLRGWTKENVYALLSFIALSFTDYTAFTSGTKRSVGSGRLGIKLNLPNDDD